LDAEAKMLYVNAANFARQTNTWIQIVANFHAALKDLGDVEAWSKAMEADLNTISSSLEYAYKGNQDLFPLFIILLLHFIDHRFL
jgi:hypothetical protein